MDFINLLKYVTGLATTLLAVYALTQNFHEEIEKSGETKKRLTNHGKTNIAIILMLGIITAFISYKEDRDKAKAMLESEKNKNELEEIRKSQHKENQDALQDNLEKVSGLVNTLEQFKEAALQNSQKSQDMQEEFALNLDKSSESIAQIEKSSSNLYEEFETRMNTLNETISSADQTIQAFQQAYKNSIEEFNLVRLKCKIDFSHYQLMHLVTKSQYNSYDIRDFESGLFAGSLDEVGNWMYQNNLGPYSEEQIKIAIHKLIYSSSKKKWRKGIYLQEVTSEFFTNLHRDWTWGISAFVNRTEADFKSLTQLPYDSIKAAGGFYEVYADFRPVYGSFEISNVIFSQDKVSLELQVTLASEQNLKFNINDIEVLDIHFLSLILRSAKIAQGEIVLNNALESKYNFSSYGLHFRIFM